MAAFRSLAEEKTCHVKSSSPGRIESDLADLTHHRLVDASLLVDPRQTDSQLADLADQPARQFPRRVFLLMSRWPSTQAGHELAKIIASVRCVFNNLDPMENVSIVLSQVIDVASGHSHG